VASRLPDRARTFVTLFGLFALLACPVFAREKTDVIVMKNGDRISCEIKSLQSGVLRVDLDYVDGTISIDWLKVARLESKFLFLVQLQDGSVYSGHVVTREELAGVPVTIEIQPVGEQPQVVERTTVVSMTPTSDSVWHRFSGNINIGSSYAKGNNTTQYNIGSELEYLDTRWGANTIYNSNLSSSSGATVSTRNQLGLTAYRLFPWKNYFYTGTVDFLQSSVQEIDRQTAFGLGVGRFLKNTNRVRFTVMGGLAWQRTYYSQSIPDQQVQNIAVGVIGSTLQVFSFKKTNLNITGTVFPALNGQGRLFSSANATYYLKIIGKIDWNLSFYGNWDTQPPGHLQGSDYGTTFGLTYKFGYRYQH